MTTKVFIQPEEIIHLSGISWQTYESLLNELSKNRRLRLTYNRGNLEIMAPSPEHERYKTLMGRFVETIAEELEIRIEPFGSTTYKYPQLSGAEPDESFYLKNIDIIRGKKRIDLQQDPPPDLVVEIDITSSSENRLQIYSDIGIAEVWCYNGEDFSIYILQNREYVKTERSLAFPNLAILEIARFLDKVGEKDYLELVKEFRQWLRNHK
ncbi:Uma2 family endonuclease [Scytonema sp. NUACC26]|uniref:Uma2 family endonuclease n=1 Tax=Scytonema sp. NUACC26 TaxID=3140176 RepID=UPI0034DBFA6B